MQGLIIKSTGSWYKLLIDGKIYDARLRGKMKQLNLKVTNPIAVGDEVICEVENEDTGNLVIKEIQERKNYFIRKSTRKTAHAHILASNLDQALLVVTLRKPRTSLGFIDRFLVAAESFQIPVKIVFNKSDLLRDKDMAYLDAARAIYDNLNYETFVCSCISKEGVGVIRQAMYNKRTLVAGHSGVGKSTLLNLLLPDLELRTAEISRYTEKGVHTTTHAEMHFLDENSSIIDSPGVKEIGLWNMEKEEISDYFPEMRALKGLCKFHNCTHDHEPGCAVLDALEADEIALSRYENYLNIILDEEL